MCFELKVIDHKSDIENNKINNMKKRKSIFLSWKEICFDYLVVYLQYLLLLRMDFIIYNGNEAIEIIL